MPITTQTILDLIKKAVDPLTAQIADLQKDIITIKTAHQTEITSLNHKISSLETQLAESSTAFASPNLSTEAMKLQQLQEKMNLLWRKMDDFDQYSRRQNLIIDGITVRKNENPA